MNQIQAWAGPVPVTGRLQCAGQSLLLLAASTEQALSSLTQWHDAQSLAVAAAAVAWRPLDYDTMVRGLALGPRALPQLELDCKRVLTVAVTV